jgi:hypothetical protein
LQARNAARERATTHRNLPQVECLDLEEIGAPPALGQGIASAAWPRLRTLRRGHLPLGNDAAEALAANPAMARLRELNLFNVSISDHGFQTLLRSPFLRNLQRVGSGAPAHEEALRRRRGKAAH